MTPDNAIFGINSKNERVLFGDVRKITDSFELLDLYKIRTKIFFFDQVEPLAENKSSFPLTMMCLHGLKSFSKIFSVSKEEIMEWICPELNNSLDLEKYNSVWSEVELGETLSSAFVSLSLREDKKGYVLDYGDDVTITEWEPGYFKINPGWFWTRLKEFFEWKVNNLSEEELSQFVKTFKEELLK